MSVYVIATRGSQVTSVIPIRLNRAVSIPQIGLMVIADEIAKQTTVFLQNKYMVCGALGSEFTYCTESVQYLMVLAISAVSLLYRSVFEGLRARICRTLELEAICALWELIYNY